MPESFSKPGWCPPLSQREESEGEGDRYKWLQDFVGLLGMLNPKSRQSLYEDAREFIYDLTERFFGAKGVRDLEQGEWLPLLEKVFAVSEAGGAPLGNRTLVVFMKLDRSIPYEVVLREETDIEIAKSLGRQTQAHNRGCGCMTCKNRKTAEETARKRVYRALQLRDKLGFRTRFVSIEEWERFEKVRELLRAAEARYRHIR